MYPVVLAPTTLMNVPPLEYIGIAIEAGYDGIGIRLYPSPGMPFFPVVGDQALMRQVRERIEGARLTVYDVLTCYLQPDMDLEAMRRAHEFGAELGARFALVIGDDPEWDRMVQNFGALCDNAAQYGIICALEAPVNRRALTTLEANLRLIEDAGRENVAINIDPAQFLRSGGQPADLRSVDAQLRPYMQINDTASRKIGDPLCMPGEGIVPLEALLDAMPPNIPLSLEYHHRDDHYTPREWASHVLEGTRAFLARYEQSRGLA